MATIYSDKAYNMRFNHEGTTTVVSRITFGAPTDARPYNSTTASVGDILMFCKLPTQSVVTRVAVFGTAADMMKIGTDSSVARFYVSSSAITTFHECSLIATGAAVTGIGYQYSASNDSSQSWEWLKGTLLVAASTNGSVITSIVQYTQY